LADFQAAALARRRQPWPHRGVLRTQPGADAVALKTLAQAIVSEQGMIVVLVGDGSPVPLVVARSANVDVDAGAGLKRAVTELGGRGGGRPEMAQGGVAATADAVLEFARRTIV
jgi:alanyl-tRNA synthetase